MPKIVQAQQLKKGLPTIDFAIADEAHRTAGIVKNKEAKAFQAIHHDLSAKRRLYQTATPRIYSTRSVKRLIDGLEQEGEVNTRVIDMRNDTDFGPELHRLTFRDALEAPESERRLVDYEIIVVTINDHIAPEAIARGKKLISNTSMYQRMAAVGLALYGVSRTIRDERPDKPINSCIGYCNTLKSAREVTRVMGDDQLCTWATGRQVAWDDGKAVQITQLTSGYIDGNTRAPQRFEELNRLEQTRESGNAHITMNAKVLTEGVDVPALDAVCFMEPRDSEIDIVQAVGRVMRKPKHGVKSKGYIIIPVVVDRQQLLWEDADTTLSRWNQDWRVLGQVLRALKSHDPSIETDLEKRINVQVGTKPNGGGGEDSSNPNFWEMLRDGVFNHLMPTIQAKLKEETEAKIQTSLIKQAIIVGARSIQKETGLAKKLAATVGVADSTNQPEKRACLQASLILTNTLLMHQRLLEQDAPEGRSLIDLSSVHRSTSPEKQLLKSWHRVLEHDYRAIFLPGVTVLEKSKVGDAVPEGMRSALRTLSEHCRTIAQKYAELGMDQAGELFQAAMDEADAEGAYYTLSPAAMLLAELACDARAPEDDPMWGDSNTWKRESILDPACGSGTLLAAMATAVRRRGNLDSIAEKNLIEMGITGMDRNSHALQISGTQLAIQSNAPSLRKLGLYTMPWGKIDSGISARPPDVRLGSLELLETDRRGRYNYGVLRGVPDDNPTGKQLLLDDSVQEKELHQRLSRTVIGITNPPYTKGAKVDKNVSAEVRKAIQRRRNLVANNVAMRRNDIGGMLEADSLSPSFSVLLEEILDKEKGVIAKVMPTTACLATDPSERIFWAKHFEIRYIVTLHNPKDLNWSVDTDITESLMIGKRRRSKTHESPDTQFVNLNRRPNSVEEVLELRDAIRSGKVGDKWGLTTHCAAHRMRVGDWSSAVWYDPALAEASWELEDLADTGEFTRLGQFGHIYTTKETVGKSKWEWVDGPQGAEVSVAKSSSGSDGYKCIEGHADGWARRAVKYKNSQRELENLVAKEGYLLVTNTQNSSSGRLIGFASNIPLVGYTWTPITSVSLEEAKALALWLNSTPGRIAMRRVLSRSLTWPMWQPGALKYVVVPNIRNSKRNATKAILRDGFEEIKSKEIDLYRDGYTRVRQEIDQIVSKATNISLEQLVKWGKKLADEPTIGGNENSETNDEL